jgi:hypothetical protein
LETQGRAGSSPDKAGTGWHCQTAWVRQTRREGVTRVNQCQSPSIDGTGSNLVDLGRVAVHTPARGVTPTPDVIFGWEATRNACGVLVAMLQGQSWAPPPSTGCVVNVGTVPKSPSPPVSQTGDGQVCRRLTTSEWGGAFVVVRDRESRSHGEGRQQVRSHGTGMSGGRR